MKAAPRGFTLIEMAFVIAIVGLLMAMGVGLVKGFMLRTQAAASRANADLIKQNLLRFLASYNRLPCPALRTLASSSSAAGLEDSSASCGTTVVGATQMAAGVVPWRTLGLPLEDVQDGYGRMYSYFVAIPATTTTSATVSTMKGVMTVHSAAPPVLGLQAASYPTGNQLNSCMNTAVPPAGGDDGNGCNMRAVVVLISHGANGYGAYLPTGSRVTMPTSTSESANTDNDTAFVNAEPSAASGSEFDDLVYAWAPGDFIDTLTQQGVLKSATTSTYDIMKATATAITNYMATNKVSGKYRVQTSIPSYGGLSAPNDAWGNAITYSTAYTTNGTNDICNSVPANATAFTLTSNGLDGVAGTNAKTGRVDDITVTVNVEDIKKLVISGATCP